MVSQILNVSGIGTNVYAKALSVNEGFTYGDVNEDGKVNSIDFAYMKQYLLQIIDEFPENQIFPELFSHSLTLALL
ncbi:MAG: Xyloglucanase Xgh74A precursor [Firmicutes bacterium ADurb.Bin419]|nr:MAG: Xyloglucanase Xgh74A precursor [Firmicutes bacterium ADurb.Bin419]